MARTKFTAEVLTPEGEVFNDEVEMVSTRTAVGSIGILANHEPLLGILEPAELRLYKSESDIVTLAQGEGYVQVAEGRVLILVEEAVEPSSLNVGDLQVALALREAHDVGLALVEAKLGRVEHGQQRLVVGQHTDRPDGGLRRDHLDLVVEHLAVRREHLDLEGRTSHQRLLFAASTTSSILPLSRNADSGRSSCLPSRISRNERTVSAIGT